jgi:Lipopolysaccharide-assembly
MAKRKTRELRKSTMINPLLDKKEKGHLVNKHMRHVVGLAIGFGALLLLGNGCAGYRVGSVAGEALQGVNTLFVPVAKNESYEPGLQVVTTNEIIRRFDNDGTLKTRQSLGADAQLDITLKSVTRQSLRGNRLDGEATEQYEVTIIAEVTLLNRKLGRKTLDKVLVQGSSKYFVQQDMQEAERQALPTAAEDLATRVVALVVEGW